ncbi:MAG: hypothetical protein ACXVI9_12805 [Mucilaginibacter sp.]
MEKALNILKKVNLVLIILGFLILIIEWLSDYITRDLFARGCLIIAVLLILTLGATWLKGVYNIIARGILIILICFASWTYASFFYEIDIVAIIIPHNYLGKVSIKFNDSRSHKRISPTNKILFIPVNSSGKFTTSSDYDIKLNHITVAEFRNHHFYFPHGVYFFSDDELLKHDSADGKYTLLKGEIVLKRDSTAAEKQKAAADTSH